VQKNHQFIPINEPCFKGNEKKYLNECIDTGWVSSTGSFVSKFEKEMANICGRKFATSTSSGTAALDIIFNSLDLKSDDEIITSNFSIISCSNSIMRNGGKVVLVDVCEKTFNMTFEGIRDKYSKKTKAILIPHIYGLPVDLDPILEFAKDKNLFVIEDAAEMHGQEYKGSPCGSFGDVSIFSYYANKLITTGEGGMILTNDESLHQKYSSLKNHSFVEGRRFVHDDIGFNYRMTNIQAALGLAQLEQLKNMVKRKREIGIYYHSLLKDVKGLSLPLNKTSYSDNIYWAYTLTIKKEIPLSGGELSEELKKYDIDSRPSFWPLNLQPIYLKNKYFDESLVYPISKQLADKCIYIPSYVSLSNDKIQYISETIKGIFSKYE
jgi:perosamine synthetase